MQTLNELKAKAYDTLAQIEFLQNQLRQLNDQIRQLSIAAAQEADVKKE